jgi:hypothetical protein
MKDLKRETINDRQVLRVETEQGDCHAGEIDCVFFSRIPRLGKSSCSSKLACMVGLSGPVWMFITEDQLPAYLAARLTGEA